MEQVCNFCLNPESILERETCCSGCSKIINPYQPERLNPEGFYERINGIYPELKACDSLNIADK